MKPSRRAFLTGVSASAALAAPALADGERPIVEWRLASSFPRGLDTIFGGAEMMSQRLTDLTDGRFKIKIHAAGELMPAFAVADAVEKGTIEAAHTATYYFLAKNRAFAFETTLPFGLNQRQQNAWVLNGEGGALLRDFMRGYNMVSFPGGNSGTQMGGWFKRPLQSPLDLRGLKFRIAGLGGEILSVLGVEPKQLAGGEILKALQAGTVDAAEWVGPYDDEKLGLHNAAKYYYFPGWWESNAMFSFLVNAQEWERLPKTYQHALRSAASDANIDMMAKYDGQNPAAMERLIEGGTKLVPFPPEVMRLAQKAAFEFYDKEASTNPQFARLYFSWRKFRDQQFAWHRIAEHTYSNFVYTTRVGR